MKQIETKTWYDITLEKFYRIRDIIAEPDDYTTFNLIDEIYGIDSQSMALNEVTKYADALKFLNRDIPTVIVGGTYTINGRKYACNPDLGSVTASQFVDYNNYATKGGKDVKFEDLLSVFFIPVDRNYNDGYDLTLVKRDLLDLDIPTVQSLAFFFAKQLQIFVRYFQRYLMKSLRKSMKKEGKKQELIEVLSKMDLADLVSFPTY